MSEWILFIILNIFHRQYNLVFFCLFFSVRQLCSISSSSLWKTTYVGVCVCVCDTCINTLRLWLCVPFSPPQLTCVYQSCCDHVFYDVLRAELVPLQPHTSEWTLDMDIYKEKHTYVGVSWITALLHIMWKKVKN